MAAARKNRHAYREADQTPKQPQQAATSIAMPAWQKWLISLVVVWHLFAVFINSLSLLPASPTVEAIASITRWYSNPIYATQGYNFFAPDPPINQVVRYQVFAETGEMITEGEFPNKKQQRPRLFYHRHMMLADQAGIGLDQYDEPARLSLRSYGRHLLRVHQGAEVQLDLVRHNPLYPVDSLAGVDPSRPEQFSPIMSVRESSANLSQPLVEPPVEPLPIPEGAQP